jgi:hypothetical protein
MAGAHPLTSLRLPIATVGLFAAAAALMWIGPGEPRTPPLSAPVIEGGPTSSEEPISVVTHSPIVPAVVHHTNGPATPPATRFLFDETSGASVADVLQIPVVKHSWARPPHSKKEPFVPMVGAVDDTAYINTIPIGTSYAIPRNTSMKGRKLRIIYGILASPATLVKRVFPQVLTTLRDEESLIFIERNDTNPTARLGFNEAQRFVHEHPELNTTVVYLDPITDMRGSIRNAWMDLPVLRLMYDKYPNRDWYAVVDDDTYTITANVRAVLANYDSTQSVALGDTLRWGEQGGYRLIKAKDGSKRFIPSTKRQPLTFICGGAGIYLSAAALAEIHPLLEKCMLKYLQPAGDVRLGACMNQTKNMTIIRRREFSKDSVLRSVGELELQHYLALPAAFHRFREPALFRRAREIEVARGRYGLVPWGDLVDGFSPGQNGFNRFDFFPNDYENCTLEFGSRPPPRKWPANIPWGKKGLPQKPKEKPESSPGEWGGCDKLMGKNL